MLDKITNGAVPVAPDVVKIETTGRGLWTLVTCCASAAVGALTYLGGYFTDADGRQMEDRFERQIVEIREHEIAQDQQLIEIAKHLGAKVVLEPASQPSSQPAKK